MAEGDLPILRGRIEKTEVFVSARGGGGPRPALPPRNPARHRAALIAQLDQIVATVQGRPAGARDAEATRELVAVIPEPGSDLPAPSLGDVASGVRVVGSDPDTGVVLVETPDPNLAALRRKLDAYADPAKHSPKGHPANEPLIAPVREIRLATLDEVGDPDVLALPADAAHWVELGCSGGVYNPAETARSRREIERQLTRVAPGTRIAAQFTATGLVVFYAKLTQLQMRALLAVTDCIHEISLAEPKMRDWLLVERDDVDLTAHVATPPPADAPGVVLLDSGTTPTHPLLGAAVRSIDSVVPGVASGVDIDGHGTQMSGVALYADSVGDAVSNGSAQPSHWLQSVKIITPGSTSSDASARAIWPPMTVDAVAKAEAHPGDRRRVFAMAVTAEIEPLVPTTWSQAVDQLAYNDGKGRLICISAGNADSNDIGLLAGYPQLNLVQRIQDPAHAWNALTVGAYTARDQMPNDDGYRGYAPIAPAGGISPHSSSRPLDASRVPNKPEIVFEGGNVAFDGALPDATVPTLTTLTTGHRPNRPLASIWATSEAAARAAHLGAAVWSANPDLRPETVRGLMVHAASWTPQMREQFASLDDRLRICGYGVPDSRFATWCARERATIVVEDSMPNAVMVAKPRKEPPKRASTPATKPTPERVAKFFRLPIDEQALLGHGGDVELRVTLSYLTEVQTYRRRAFRGLGLRWDMQGPQESEDAFQWRVNKRVRENVAEAPKGKTFAWDIGPERRERGTVQSDRWTGPAAFLAGAKLIAVMPVGGWWNEYVAFLTKELPFALIVTVQTPGLDIYSLVEVALTPAVVITT
jgi:hypothetical protein